MSINIEYRVTIPDEFSEMDGMISLNTPSLKEAKDRFEEYKKEGIKASLWKIIIHLDEVGDMIDDEEILMEAVE